MAGRSKTSGTKGKGAKKRAGGKTAKSPAAKKTVKRAVKAKRAGRTKKACKSKAGAKLPSRDREIETFIRDLTANEKVALTIRDELYSGSWGRMQEDLNARSAGRPYVFRLASRIEEDLRIIEKLSAFESRMEINLSKFLEEGR